MADEASLNERPTAQDMDEDEKLLNNILPSYHMYQSTISKNLTPSTENFKVDPPMYEMTPVNSTATTPSFMLSAVQSPSDEFANVLVDGFPFPTEQEENTFNDANAEIWENTILANVHKLPNLTKQHNATLQDLEIKIHVTKNVCQKGVKPTIIDPSKLEFRQGDFIHGFVTIINKSPLPITFDMVYVVFEGTLTVLENSRGFIDNDKPITVYKFLNMLDLFASWSYANIDRLVTDNGDPHDWCEGETDPYDNTALSIDVKRLFKPGVVYKRYFTFRVPEKLLDDVCEFHNLTKHTDVPPSLGIPRNIPPSVMLANKDSQIRDLSFIDTAINYSVDARVIGRASDYNYATDNDQYVIAQEAMCPLRIIPMAHPEAYYNRTRILQDSMLFYKAFIDSVKEKIAMGRDLLNVPAGQRSDFLALLPAVSRDSQSHASKLRQLYDVAGTTIKRNFMNNRKLDNDNMYQCLVPYKKKSLTGSSKILGIVSLSTPKEEYRAFYTPPVKYRRSRQPQGVNTEMTVPIELSYFVESATGKPAMPEIKSVTTELVVLTVRSKKYYIPVEFNHDMCFRDQEIDQKKELANFDVLVVKQFHDYLQEITRLIQTLGNDLMKVESQLYKDVKCLAALQTKYINLLILDSDTKYYTKTDKGTGMHTSLKTIAWENEVSNGTGALYTKKFDLSFDLGDFHLKGSDKNKGIDYLTLVPNFQTCLMARLYYIKITVKLTTGEPLVVNVPLTIER